MLTADSPLSSTSCLAGTKGIGFILADSPFPKSKYVLAESAQYCQQLLAPSLSSLLRTPLIKWSTSFCCDLSEQMTSLATKKKLSRGSVENAQTKYDECRNAEVADTCLPHIGDKFYTVSTGLSENMPESARKFDPFE